MSTEQTSFHPLSAFRVILVWSYNALRVALASPTMMRPDQLHSVVLQSWFTRANEHSGTSEKSLRPHPYLTTNGESPRTSYRGQE